MSTELMMPQRYTLGALKDEALTQLPRLLGRGSDFFSGFVGDDRLPGDMRLAVQLRLARVLGCPVCVNVFPPVARRAGFDAQAVQSALEGRPEGLPPRVYGAVALAEQILQADGALPAAMPEPALLLTQAQTRHLTFMMRLELVVHATGLMFLPHAWIQRARSG